MDALKRCPFCGCAAVTEIFRPLTRDAEHFVRCYSPVCRIMGPSCATEDEAIAAWNKRASAGDPGP